MGKSVYNPLRTTHPRPLLELRPGSCVCVCVCAFLMREKNPLGEMNIWEISIFHSAPWVSIRVHLLFPWSLKCMTLDDCPLRQLQLYVVPNYLSVSLLWPQEFSFLDHKLSYAFILVLAIFYPAFQEQWEGFLKNARNRSSQNCILCEQHHK